MAPGVFAAKASPNTIDDGHGSQDVIGCVEELEERVAANTSADSKHSSERESSV